jgi:hypothetical protein
MLMRFLHGHGQAEAIDASAITEQFNTVEALLQVSKHFISEHPETVTKRPTNGLQHEVQVAAPTKSKICKRKLYLLVKTSWNIPSFHINMMLLLVYEYQLCPRANF